MRRIWLPLTPAGWFLRGVRLAIRGLRFPFR